jgi:hypothetical protein
LLHIAFTFFSCCCIGVQLPKQDTCPANVNITSKLASFTALPSNNEAALLQALQNGPIAVSVTVDANFMDYTSGVYASDTCTRPVVCGGANNHAMVIVGAGRDEMLGVDYWVLRNR